MHLALGGRLRKPAALRVGWGHGDGDGFLEPGLELGFGGWLEFGGGG